MRLTFFNEPVFQPGDDFAASWVDHFGEEPLEPMARFIEFDEDESTWGCEIMDNDDHEAQANDFNTEMELISWLESHNIEIER